MPASHENNPGIEIAGLDEEADDEAEEFDDGPWIEIENLDFNAIEEQLEPGGGVREFRCG